MTKVRVASYAIVRSVEQRHAKRWLRGVGKDAEFAEDSVGWYAVLNTSPASIFLGDENLGLKPGDCVKITVEKAS